LGLIWSETEHAVENRLGKWIYNCC